VQSRMGVCELRMIPRICMFIQYTITFLGDMIYVHRDNAEFAVLLQHSEPPARGLLLSHDYAMSSHLLRSLIRLCPWGSPSSRASCFDWRRAVALLSGPFTITARNQPCSLIWIQAPSVLTGKVIDLHPTRLWLPRWVLCVYDYAEVEHVFV
jgi:hypothetical protein